MTGARAETREQSLQYPTTAMIVGVAVVSMVFWGGTPSATRFAIAGFDPVMAAAMRISPIQFIVPVAGIIFFSATAIIGGIAFARRT